MFRLFALFRLCHTSGMTVNGSTLRALESAVSAPPDVSDLMPAARRMTVKAGEIPSGRRLMRDLSVGWAKAAETRRQLIAENPLLPVSGGAPAYDPAIEVTAPFHTLPAPLPAEAAAKTTGRRHRTQTLALIVPLLLVNSAALYGQAGWAYDHLGHSRFVAVLFAAAVESIGVYLAAEAHGALMAGDASAQDEEVDVLARGEGVHGLDL